MEITWYGDNCFLLEGDHASLLVDPTQQTSIKADIALTTVPELIKLTDKHATHIFDWPGEYEAKGIAITLLPFDEEKNEHLIAHVVIDDFRVAILGHMGEKLKNEHVDRLGDVDILILPIGGGDVYDAKKATDMLETIEPKSMIPSMFVDGGEEFSKVAGIKFGDAKNKAKFSSPSILPTDRTDYILLSPQS